MKMTRTWDSTMSMIPKGGDTIWGDLDWSPEEDFVPTRKKQKTNDTQSSRENRAQSPVSESKTMNYGRIISFGKNVSEAHSSEIERTDFKVSLCFS